MFEYQTIYTIYEIMFEYQTIYTIYEIMYQYQSSYKYQTISDIISIINFYTTQNNILTFETISNLSI